MCTAQNSSLHTAHLHRWCRRMKTVPATGPRSSLTGPQDISVSTASACAGGPGCQTALSHAFSCLCSLSVTETHQSSPGRNSKHILTGRLPPSPERCVIGRDGRGLRGGRVAARREREGKTWILMQRTGHATLRFYFMSFRLSF